MAFYTFQTLLDRTDGHRITMNWTQNFHDSDTRKNIFCPIATSKYVVPECLLGFLLSRKLIFNWKEHRPKNCGNVFFFVWMCAWCVSSVNDEVFGCCFFCFAFAIAFTFIHLHVMHMKFHSILCRKNLETEI